MGDQLNIYIYTWAIEGARAHRTCFFLIVNLHFGNTGHFTFVDSIRFIRRQVKTVTGS